MTLPLRLLLSLVAALSPSIAAGSGPIDPHNPPQGRFSDDWAEVFMAGGKVGYMHSAMAREGNLINTDMTMVVEIARANQRIKISVTQQTSETVAGAPLGFASTQDVSVMHTTMKGTIKDGKVTIVSSQYGMEKTETFDFPSEAIMTWGSLRENLLRGFKPGTQYTLKVYAPEVRWDDAVPTRYAIGEWEELSGRGGKMRGQKVTLVMETPGGPIETVSWVDQYGSPVKAVVLLPGMGNLEIITADQKTALADFVPPELFMTTTIKAKRVLDPKATYRVKYRITSKSPDVEIGEFPTTGMQTIEKRGEGAVELVLTRQSHKPTQRPPHEPKAADMAEFLDSNLMINIDDPELIGLAKKAADGETEPFALADKLRRFVTRYVKKKSLDVGFATASEVCRNREGDCSEHGVLLAALGRLCGLPSRVVVGIAYVPVFGERTDIFGYHMWTQFFIDGRWIDVDAALRETVCSPTRIAFATSSLKYAGMADLSLPLLTKIGAIDIDILEVEETADPND